MNHNKIKFIVVIALFILPAVVFAYQQTVDLEITQTNKGIKIDGKLNEWDNFQEIPVNLNFVGKKIESSSDITVTARFTFDEKYFYAAVKAIDDKFEFPSRSWRYGDGFYLTFIDPYQGNESDRTFSYGISLIGKSLTKALVYRDGVYFPGMVTRQIKLEIRPDEENGVITYEVMIPWENILPLQPFIHKSWGVNIVYVDRDDGERQILQLYPDPRYDTELSNLRKGEIFNFKPHIPSKYEFQSCINASHFSDDDEKIITIAVNSPDVQSQWKIEYNLNLSDKIISDFKNVDIVRGMNLFKIILKNDSYATGTYDLKLKILDNNNKIQYEKKEKIFILNRNDLTKLDSQLSGIKKRPAFLNNERLRESIPALEIRLEWIKDFVENAMPFSKITSLVQWYEEVKMLIKNLDEGKAALFPSGKISRIAHRSKIDYTLQPYSVFVPDTYDNTKSMSLFVVLHGSGVDEKNTIRYMTRLLRKKGNWIVLAPQGRGLSDWYIGDSGEDVIECINHVKKLYNIDEKNIILDGFSMGGYGVWRLGLLHPEIFKTLIIRSGAVSAPFRLKGENILTLLEEGKGRGLNIFIVHGDIDNAVPVENARSAVQKLKDLGIEHKYIEIEGAAHGGYDKWNEIFEWLETIK